MGVPQTGRAGRCASRRGAGAGRSRDSVGVDVVGDGGAAELDGVGEDFDEGGAEAGEFGAGEAAGLAAGADAGAEEALVGVDVADAVEQGLVEQGGFDGGLAVAEEGDEVFEGDGEGFGAGAGVLLRVCGCDDGEAAEAAGVDEAEFALPPLRVRTAWVWAGWDVGRGDEQAAGHAEMDEELRRASLRLGRGSGR